MISGNILTTLEAFLVQYLSVVLGFIVAFAFHYRKIRSLQAQVITAENRREDMIRILKDFRIIVDQQALLLRAEKKI